MMVQWHPERRWTRKKKEKTVRRWGRGKMCRVCILYLLCTEYYSCHTRWHYSFHRTHTNTSTVDTFLHIEAQVDILWKNQKSFLNYCCIDIEFGQTCGDVCLCSSVASIKSFWGDFKTSWISSSQLLKWYIHSIESRCDQSLHNIFTIK